MAAKAAILVFVVFLVWGIHGQDPLLVEYYNKLITSRIAEAMKNDIPKDNRYFMGDKGDLNRIPIDVGEYDFIIVGAGSSGSVVARRLTEIPQWKVLLVEAGGKEDNFTDIPNMLLFLEGLKYSNWGYYTIPQKTCCQGMTEKRCNYPRGKIVGGTGTINALMYCRGNRRDYDSWAVENPGWSYQEVLPYFLKSEDVDPKVKYEPLYHSVGGPLHVDYSIPMHPLLGAFIEGSQLMGIPKLDYNGRVQLGTAPIQITTKFGRRQTGGRSFLDDILDRPNLFIWLHSLATKILIKHKKAFGIHFIKNGVLYQATAKREVIISGGTINTPQLLMLSGIGPKEHLKKLGIRTVVDLPVGRNLKEHPTFFGFTLDTNFTNPPLTQRQQIKMYLKGIGPFTNPGNSQGITYTRVKSRPTIPNYPDVEYVFIPPESINPFSFIQYNFNPANNVKYLGKVRTRRMPRVYVALLHPISTGSVTLVSNSPFDFPAIDLNMFSDPGGNDLEALYEGVEFLLRITSTEPFKKYNAHLLDAPIPACQKYQYLSKQYWKCAILQLTGTFYHPTGTARMGRAGENSVVDNELRVHGIERLRVIDCSVIPEQPSGHTNAIAFMIGEKGSDLIKMAHGAIASKTTENDNKEKHQE